MTNEEELLIPPLEAESPIPANPDDRGQWTHASDAEADGLCLGRHLAQKPFRTQEPGGDEDDIYAQYGRAVHAALATGDFSGLHGEQIDVVEAAIEIERKALESFFGAEVIGKKSNPVREKRLWFTFRDVEGNVYAHSGKPDAVHRFQVRGLICEYKALFSKQKRASRNAQLRDQVCLVHHNTSLLREVATVIIQPQVTLEPEICVYKDDDIAAAKSLMINRIMANHNPRSPRCAGEIQCNHCLAKSVCEVYAAWSTALVPEARGILDVPVAQWSPEQRAFFCANLSRAQKWLDETKEEMKKILRHDPKSIPGWRLGPPQYLQPIVKPEEVFKRWIAKGGDGAAYLSCVRVTKDDLHDQLRALTGLKGSKLEDAFMALLQGCTARIEKRRELERAS